MKGRVIALVGILIVATTLRSAVTVVPPVVSEIGKDLPIDSLTIGLLGMLPTLAFAFFGFFTPMMMRWTSLEKLLIGAMAVAIIGQVARVFAPNTPLFLIFTVLGLAGLGAGNVLLPPLVKHYFPDRLGLVTALYVTMISVGTALPAQLSVPVASAAGWQFSLASWAVLNFVAVVPWIVLLLGRKQREAAATQSAMAAAAAPERKISVWRSTMGLGLTLMFGCTSLNTYAMFAWLPQILTEAGLSHEAAGSMLALFAGLGLPLSLVIPLFASRMRNPLPVVVFLLICFVSGYLGILLSPGNLTWLWVVLAGIGPGTFPLSLLLINLRTRSRQGAGALSGFSQGVGYALACIGPVLFGVLHQATGNWTTGFIFLFVSLGVLGLGAFFACRPIFLEDQQGDPS
ncbi:CP family cyanate transporter-like MFS transporter [Psychromicrobium silvestre]|uniref:CP family cyanate transporter-like MFS transporter n=1 Tax=Psychromicrobium silvestre TaxID=1645614 RepID=A0A7Y9S649_9MICC|nr:MFS transporter [Psychromicrobium silvestre]NYE94820.1 CP family cyanate transporter-like MFS transporter [Psychromicrobium silvestre]